MAAFDYPRRKIKSATWTEPLSAWFVVLSCGHVTELWGYPFRTSELPKTYGCMECSLRRLVRKESKQ